MTLKPSNSITAMRPVMRQCDSMALTGPKRFFLGDLDFLVFVALPVCRLVPQFMHIIWLDSTEVWQFGQIGFATGAGEGGAALPPGPLPCGGAALRTQRSRSSSRRTRAADPGRDEKTRSLARVCHGHPDDATPPDRPSRRPRPATPRTRRWPN